MTQDANLEKLETLLKLVNEGLSREEFVTAFENVVSLVLKIEKRNTDAVDKIESTYASLLAAIKGDSAASLDDVKTRSKFFLDDARALLAKAQTDIAARLATVKDGQDGKNGADGKDGKDGKDGSPDAPEDVRDKLETLEGDARLDISAIKGLDDYEKLKEAANQPTRTSGGGGSSRNSVEFIDLSGQLNGSRKTFTVPRRRFIALFGTEFPVIYRPDIDYTGSGTYTLSLTSQVAAPEAGQTLILLYSRL
jgi:hypothetical protein